MWKWLRSRTARKLDQQRRIILCLLRCYGPMRCTEIADLAGFNAGSLYWVLWPMEEEGLINGYWGEPGPERIPSALLRSSCRSRLHACRDQPSAE